MLLNANAVVHYWTWHANISSGGQVKTEFIEVYHQWQGWTICGISYFGWHFGGALSMFVISAPSFFLNYVYIALNTFLRSNMAVPR